MGQEQMSETDRSGAWRTPIAIAITSGALAGVSTAAIDTIQAASSTHVATFAWATGLRLFAALCSMYLTLGLLIGLFAGVVIAGFNCVFGRGFFSRLWRWLRENRQADSNWSAALVAATVSLGLVAMVVYRIHDGVSSGFSNTHLAALFLGTVSAASVLLALLVFFPIFSLLLGVTNRMARAGRFPLFAILACGLAALGVGAGLWLVMQTDWRIINFSPYVGLGLMLTLQVVFAAILHRIDGRISRSVKRGFLPAGAVILTVAIWVTTVRAYDSGEQQLAVITQDDAWSGSMLLRLGRGFTDRDGDGYSSSFKGGDCNDDDPEIHPGARDVPGDGVDQDCLGGDAKPPPRPVKVERKDLPEMDPMKGFRFDGNFLVIIVDTFREDRLGIEEYERKITPNIDEFISEAVFFRNAFAQGNRTPHSFGSFLTSRYPSRVKWKRKKSSYSPLLDENLLIFEALRDISYRNIAVLRHFYFHPRRNLQQGFEDGDWVNKPTLSIKETNTDIAAPDVTARAVQRLRQLKQSGEKFCLWVHYPDPHSRYMQHQEYPLDKRGRAGLIQKYDYEIKFTDKHFGKLLAALDEFGLSEKTAVVLFGDHGEAFGRHRLKGKRMYFHGQTLYNELLHVPLAFRVPGIEPRVVEDRVMLLDIAPTMVDMTQNKIPEEFRGSSLVPYFFGRKLPKRAIRAELPPYKAWPHEMVMMIKGKWKLIYRVSDNVFELYDLSKDPNEMKNVAPKHPEVLKNLKAEIRNY
jgi:arylsulfatase A-like enzyme